MNYSKRFPVSTLDLYPIGICKFLFSDMMWREFTKKTWNGFVFSENVLRGFKDNLTLEICHHNRKKAANFKFLIDCEMDVVIKADDPNEKRN